MQLCLRKPAADICRSTCACRLQKALFVLCPAPCRGDGLLPAGELLCADGFIHIGTEGLIDRPDLQNFFLACPEIDLHACKVGGAHRRCLDASGPLDRRIDKVRLELHEEVILTCAAVDLEGREMDPGIFLHRGQHVGDLESKRFQCGPDDMVLVHAAREILAEGDAAMKDNDLLAAMEAYDRVPESSAVYKQAQEKRTAAQKQYVTDISDSVDKLVGSGSYAKAMTTLNDALKVLPDDEALQTKRATVGAAFEAITLDAISEDVNREDYAAAIKALQEALKVMPDSAKLSDRLDELKDLQKEQEKEVKSI